tara:strand:- start:93 stop:1151 length:1059 start_codon:yes stop_codon:yes gene_type:complete
LAAYNKKYIFRFIAQLLHPKCDIDNSYFPISHKFWEELVKIGSRHLVLPSIYGAITRNKLNSHVPKDLISYLEKITNVNENRNIEILKQIVFLSNIFEKNQIEYVFLKGAAMLILKPYDTINERMIGDIDILVSEKDLIKSQNILIDNGFKILNNDFNFVKDIIPQKHLKRVVHSNYIAAVEIHRRLLANPNANQIETKDVLRNKLKTSSNLWIPSRNHLWMHTIFNWQYNDNGLEYNNLSLRSFVDAVYLEDENINDSFDKYPAIRRFYSLCSVFVDNYQNRDFLNVMIYKYTLIYQWFEYVNFLLSKLKIMLIKILNRLILLFNSSKYRRRLLQNPKLIIKRIFIYWRNI